jgi:sugar lactone lactonase YvrE
MDRWVVFTWLVGIPSTVLLACSSEPVESEVVRKTIGPDGGIITSADGVLTLGIRPSTFEEPTEVSIGQSNEPPPAWGPAYRVEPNLELSIAATVTYQHTLPQDAHTVALGAISQEDFEAGLGDWVSLPVVGIDERNEIVRATDMRLSRFYTLLAEGGEEHEDTGTTGGDEGIDVTSGGGSDGSDGSDDGTTTGSSTTTTSASTSTTGDDTDDDFEVTYPPECESLFMGPFSVLHATGMPLFPEGGSEDLAMTGTGTFVGLSGTDLLEVDNQANTSLWASGAPAPVLGARFNAQGALLLATYTQGTIHVMTRGGAAQVFADGFGTPNGLYPDAVGNVWVTDSSMNQVVRIAPNQNRTVIASGSAAAQANGIVYDDLRRMVFWTTYADARLWRASIQAGGMPGEPVLVVELAGNSDGIALDVCGNLYVVDHNGGGSSRVDRVFLDEDAELEGPVQEIAGTDVLWSSCSNAQFGHGFGAYEQNLFVTGPSGNVYLIDVQVDGHPIAPM